MWFHPCSVAAIFFVCILPALGNVEKVVFLGPKPIAGTVLGLGDSLSSPYLELLNPSESSLRRVLHSTFEESLDRKESDAWVLLDDLEVGRRYEIRVCWSATQPTSFDLTTYELQHFEQQPELASSLQDYLRLRSVSRLHQAHSQTNLNASSVHTVESSNKLLFHIRASADYYSTNQKLMNDGLLVEINLILDPFLYNILPRSLLPTSIYLLLLVAIAWPLSSYIHKALHQVASSNTTGKDKRA